MRIGHGYDVHRLVAGRKLILGGVEVPFEKGLDGHSDADVLVHAVMDALLGAAAASGVLDISAEEMESAVAVNVKEKFLDMNRKALTLGMTAFEKA